MRTQRTVTFWKKAERFSPILCRLLARRSPGGPPLTNQEIAERAGLPVYRVVAISEQTDWGGIDLPTMRRFIDACGVDFENPEVYRRVSVYLRGKRVGDLRVAPQFAFLRRSPDWEGLYMPLAVRWIAALEKSK